VLVDKIAKSGQTNEAGLTCMLGSLLIRDPKDTLEVYGGDDINLREGYRALIGALERDPSTLQREPLRYALAMLGLERQLAKRDDMLDVIGKRLPQIQSQVEHFGPAHENVIAACGALYQDTLSTSAPTHSGTRRHAQLAATEQRLEDPRPAAGRYPFGTPVAAVGRASLAAGRQPPPIAQRALSVDAQQLRRIGNTGL
jgi:CII-binding regulator of phage lambda lysogenization HflD